MNLYELTSDYARILDAIDAIGDDAEPQEMEQLLADLEQLDTDLTTKAANYARIIRSKRLEADAYAAEIQRLEKRKRAAKGLAERLTENLRQGMLLTGVTDIQTDIGKWHVQQNPWSSDVIDANAVPEKYRIPQPDAIDKRSALNDFKATGEIIPGFSFDRKLSLRFK